MTDLDPGPSDVPRLREDQRPAMADFFRVYAAHADAIESRAREWKRQHPLLAAAMERVPERDALWLGADMNGQDRCRAQLQQLAAACQHAGVSLSGACEAACCTARLTLPYVVEAYASHPERLTAVVQAMGDLTAYATQTVAEAYLEITTAQLRAREEDLETTFDSIGDAVIVTDADARIQRMNPVAQRLTGYALEDALGKPLEEVFRIENEDTHEPVESPVARVIQEGVVVGLANHTELVARDGTRRPIADSGAPVRRETGEVRGVVLVFRDVSAERQAEQALRHWERIFQHANWGVALADVSDVTFRAVNPEYARMHGYTVEELLGAPVSTLWTPDTRADMERHAQETRDHGHLVVETTHLCKDGSVLPVEIVATTIKDARGNVAWFVANVQDISERKRLEQLRVRAIELEAENRRIEEANRLKSEFLASMSHELRTPLNSIIGFSELLHDEQSDPVTPEQKEFLKEILEGGRHLLRLINDVLDLAKVEAGKMEFFPEPVDLPSVVESMVQSLRTTAVEKRLQVDVVVSSALHDVVLDPVRFKQILYNYLSNALKFTPDHGQVTVRVLPEGQDHFRLEVEDSGIGVVPEDVPRLFVEFQQLNSGNAKDYHGTGLGLALTKRLVGAQGGSVGMRSADKQGSVFFAVLPRRPAGFPQPPPRPAPKRSETTILVVEDDATDRSVLVRGLRDAGYVVDAASTCAQAAAAWKQSPYDAIAIDLLLDDREHLQDLMQLIRSDERRCNVPVIALTMVANGDMIAGFAVADVLVKPVDAQKLVSALARSGVLPTRGRPVLVLDDDPGSLKLMEATLANLGHDALCCSHAREALHLLQHVRPIALILDLIMPEMDGLAFLERFRASPENEHVPIMVWTIKDLSASERRRLEATVSAVVQKGVGGGPRLSFALQTLLCSQELRKEQT